MRIEIIRLAIDFGLVVLIWMVQLLIYPSFKHFGSTGLSNWHRIYTRNITFIVAPMMIAQFAIMLYFWMYFPVMFAPNILYTILVSLTWLTTIVFFIPMHTNIDKNATDLKLLDRLTNLNWMRVLLWNAILVLDLFLLY
ncbi:hypothetical protein FNJ87_08555 [Nonlabens mediterrranea]|uniref:DUF1772 domain-containing protein n=1 Tax=Nonlabens mediterrranea TaxID=1419947 RepID=A0ABS0A4Y8_9FLAO|nr:hypothetical protein BBFL7_00165 [Flavobacteria bacterium BBFL7]MBF4984374.1 hypothetical protein [Nonlabens mediterrranea]